jgi:hypothetical protein
MHFQALSDKHNKQTNKQEDKHTSERTNKTFAENM